MYQHLLLISKLSSALGLLGRPTLQTLILFLGEAHEGAVLGSGDTLDIDGVGEVAQVFVGLTDAVVLRLRRVLYIGHTPCIITHELEGRGALALLAPLEIDIVVLHRFAPRTMQRGGSSGIDTGLAALLLDEHVVEAVALKVVDICIDGSIAPVEERLRLGEAGKRLVMRS